MLSRVLELCNKFCTRGYVKLIQMTFIESFMYWFGRHIHWYVYCIVLYECIKRINKGAYIKVDIYPYIGTFEIL